MKKFKDFINESVEYSLDDRAIDVIILDCLSRFDEKGGNNYIVNWDVTDFAPDIFVNIWWEPKDHFYVDIERVTELFKDDHTEITERFLKYGMIIEKLSTDETILYIAGVEQNGSFLALDKQSKLLTKNLEIVKKFYENREMYTKELEDKLKLYLKGKKFGI
jgi:hypothetical protein